MVLMKERVDSSKKFTAYFCKWFNYKNYRAFITVAIRVACRRSFITRWHLTIVTGRPLNRYSSQQCIYSKITIYTGCPISRTSFNDRLFKQSSQCFLNKAIRKKMKEIIIIYLFFPVFYFYIKYFIYFCSRRFKIKIPFDLLEMKEKNIIFLFISLCFLKNFSKMLLNSRKHLQSNRCLDILSKEKSIPKAKLPVKRMMHEKWDTLYIEWADITKPNRLDDAFKPTTDRWKGRACVSCGATTSHRRGWNGDRPTGRVHIQ